ncbi:branched-chain amino acid permease [Neisseria gonorrhoeae]|nr:branched-chain amino acid permease [Neisseria gonorrhoeae]KDN00831.1 branched-chain amino acid permease [Neisseria gonorrhoeae]KDN03106.1 branched-chain amino acid permease [Neisseria gonorrhoeae]
MKVEMPSEIRFQTAVLCLWGGYFSGLYFVQTFEQIERRADVEIRLP